MADARVFDKHEWDFLEAHPSIIWEGVHPVYYRHSNSVTGVINIDRFDIYLTLSQK